MTEKFVTLEIEPTHYWKLERVIALGNEIKRLSTEIQNKGLETDFYFQHTGAILAIAEELRSLAEEINTGDDL